MSEADEMFKKLGYERISNAPHFKKEINNYTDRHIDFDVVIRDDKTISVYEFDSIDGEYMFTSFTMQELQAINEKCKELGWL